MLLTCYLPLLIYSNSIQKKLQDWGQKDGRSATIQPHKGNGKSNGKKVEITIIHTSFRVNPKIVPSVSERFCVACRLLFLFLIADPDQWHLFIAPA